MAEYTGFHVVKPCCRVGIPGLAKRLLVSSFESFCDRPRCWPGNGVFKLVADIQIPDLVGSAEGGISAALGKAPGVSLSTKIILAGRRVIILCTSKS